MATKSEETALLIAQAGPLNGQRWAIRGDMTLGREESCEIVIADRQVSRHHARLQLTDNGVVLEDLGSKNGTNVNGQVVLEPVLLHDNDVIQVSLAQTFIFLSSDSTVPLEVADTVAQLLAAGAHPPAIDTTRRLRLDKRARRVWIRLGDSQRQHDVEILPPLSAAQFHLLEILYENTGQVISRQDVVAAIWGFDQAFEVSEQALDALVRRLRERIASFDPDHTYLVTVRGHGLRLDNPTLEE